jgi:hypothetical protein
VNPTHSSSILSPTLVPPRPRRTDTWCPTEPKCLHPSPPCHLPLTDFLKRTPEFRRAFLPDSISAAVQINRVTRSTGYFIPPSQTTRQNRMYGRVGLAVERAALHLSGEDLMEHPRAVLNSPKDQRLRLLRVLEKYASTESPGGLRRGNKATVGWLLILGALEPIRKGIRPFSDIDVTSLPRSSVSVGKATTWLASRVPDDLCEEFGELISSLEAILPHGIVMPSPSFGSWGAVLESQGDLLVERCLIELKCSVRAVRSEYVAQLLCYAAINALNRQLGRRLVFDIDGLALVLPRQRCAIAGTVEEWLSAFGGPTFDAFVSGFAAFANSFGYADEPTRFPPLSWALPWARPAPVQPFTAPAPRRG